MRPVRMTTRRLMLVVLIVAGLLALVRPLGLEGMVPLSVGLLFGGVCWRLVRAHRRLALWCFAASAVATNASVAALCAYTLSIGGLVLMFLVSSLTIPLILGSGV